MWLVAAGIAALTVGVYWNTLDAGYVNWDDRGYIEQNPLVTGDGGLGAIWRDVFADKPREQYYPALFSTYWIEYRIVGAEPRLYHAVQFALHAANALLILLVMRQLGMPLFVAAAVATLFAVHPIHVASVTWLAERKNTLSGLFFWAALLFYIHHRRSPAAWRYAVAIGCFVLALFSKTAVVVLVPILVLTDRLLDGRWTLASFRRATPFFALSVVMTLVTMHVEKLMARGGTPIDVALRPFVAAAALVHYVVKLVAPYPLVPIYPRWGLSLAEPRYWISLLALAAAAAWLWRIRRRVAPAAWWGIGAFVFAAAPTLGLKHFNFLQYSFVSDHFIYLAAPGFLLVIGLLLHRLSLVGAPAARPAVLPWLALGVIAAVLGLLTVRQNRVWHNPETFWTHTLRYNAECFAAQYNLGNHYNRRGEYEKALERYVEAARIDDRLINTRKSCANCCRRLNRPDEAVEWYRKAVAAGQKKNPRYTRVRLELADYLRSLGRHDEAREHYEAILKVRPNDAGALAGLRALGAPRSSE